MLVVVVLKQRLLVSLLQLPSGCMQEAYVRANKDYDMCLLPYVKRVWGWAGPCIGLYVCCQTGWFEAPGGLVVETWVKGDDGCNVHGCVLPTGAHMAMHDAPASLSHKQHGVARMLPCHACELNHHASISIIMQTSA